MLSHLEHTMAVISARSLAVLATLTVAFILVLRRFVPERDECSITNTMSRYYWGPEAPQIEEEAPEPLDDHENEPLEELGVEGEPEFEAAVPGDSEWGSPGYTKVLIWNRYHVSPMAIWDKIFGQVVRGECPVSSCAFSRDHDKLHEADVVLFHFQNVFWSHYHLPSERPAGQIWVLMCYETPLNAANRFARGKHLPRMNYTYLDNIFNLTMNYRLDADITTRHGLLQKLEKPLTDEELAKAYPPFDRKVDFTGYTYKTKDTEQQKQIAPIVWFCSHCSTKSKREVYFKKLTSYIRGHKYGTCGNMNCGHTRKLRNSHHIADDPCFNKTNENYRFIASFENAMCKDYVTEKVYNGLYHNVIPLVMTGSIQSNVMLPPHSVINTAYFKEPQDLAEYLYYLLRNETAYMEYFAWRRNYHVKSYFSIPDTCEFCQVVKQYLPGSGRTKVYPDMRDWFVTQSECVRPENRTAVALDRDEIIEEWLHRRELENIQNSL